MSKYYKSSDTLGRFLKVDAYNSNFQLFTPLKNVSFNDFLPKLSGKVFKSHERMAISDISAITDTI